MSEANPLQPGAMDVHILHVEAVILEDLVAQALAKEQNKATKFLLEDLYRRVLDWRDNFRADD